MVEANQINSRTRHSSVNNDHMPLRKCYSFNSRAKDLCFYMILYAKLQPNGIKSLVSMSKPAEIQLRVNVKKETKINSCGELSVAEDSFGDGKIRSFKWITDEDADFHRCWLKHPGVIQTNTLSIMPDRYPKIHPPFLSCFWGAHTI